MDITYERIQTLLREKNIKESTLCAEADIRRSTFADWRAARSKPNAKTLSKIARYLHVSIDYLLGATEDKHTIRIHPGIIYGDVIRDLGNISRDDIDSRRIINYVSILFGLGIIDKKGAVNDAHLNLIRILLNNYFSMQQQLNATTSPDDPPTPPD